MRTEARHRVRSAKRYSKLSLGQIKHGQNITPPYGHLFILSHESKVYSLLFIGKGEDLEEKQGRGTSSFQLCRKCWTELFPCCICKQYGLFKNLLSEGLRRIQKKTC